MMVFVNKITVMLASAAVALSLAGLLGFRAANYEWAGPGDNWEWAGDASAGDTWDWALPDAGAVLPSDA